MRHVSNWIETYCNALAHGEAPEKFHFWVAVSTIAGALRRKVVINQGLFRWYPNFFIVLVGEPGLVKKGTAMKNGISLLRKVPGVCLGSDVATWQGFLIQLENSLDAFAVGNVNGSLLHQKHVTSCALTICITEWGTFIDLRDDKMISMLTKLWDCEDDVSLSKTTATQGDVQIVNPFVNMLAATTPRWMHDNIKQQFGGWGVSSRIIFVFASRPSHVVAYPSRQREAAERLNATMDVLGKDLLEIAKLRGEYHLTEEAYAYGELWYAAHVERQLNLAQQPDTNPWLSYFLARKFDHGHKLAMVLAASQRSELIIEAADLKAALSRMDEVENEMLSIFGGRSAPETVSAAARVNSNAWRHLRLGLLANPRMSRSHLHHFLARYMDYRSANDFLSQLVAMQYIAQEQDHEGIWITLGPEAPQPEDRA